MIWAQSYDHHWVPDKNNAGTAPELAAFLYDPINEHTLDCLMTQLGIQIYTTHFLKAACAGSDGIYYQMHGATPRP